MDDSSPYITLICSIQAETEDLAKRVQALSAENINLKSEINKLTENSEKLKLENTALMVYTNIHDCFLLLCHVTGFFSPLSLYFCVYYIF